MLTHLISCVCCFLLCCVALPASASLGVTCHVSHYSMSVSSLFASALQVVMNDVILYEREFPYLPSNVRTQIAKVMSRRGILNSRNMPLVHRHHYTICPSCMSTCIVHNLRMKCRLYIECENKLSHVIPLAVDIFLLEMSHISSLYLTVRDIA